MIDIILVGAISFFITLMLIPKLGEKLTAAGITGIDVHKKSRPVLPEMGGLGVVIGFFIGFILIIAVNSERMSAELAAGLIAILGAAFVGVIDDLINLRRRLKALLPFLFGLPLALTLTDTTITIPGAGTFELGWTVLLLIPFAVTSAANVTNMLEGFNGLSTGIGIIICIFLGLIAFMEGSIVTLLLISPLLGALVAFLHFNSYPAKIFPGDALTLFTGATIATAAILGSVEFIAALMFLPLMLEFLLKAKGRYSNGKWPASFGKPDKSGVLHYSGPTESLTHWFMKSNRYRERDLVRSFWMMEFVLCVIVLFIFLIISPIYSPI